MTAQMAMAQSYFKTQPTEPQPINLDPYHVAPAMGQVMSALVNRPEKLDRSPQATLFSGYVRLWSEMVQKSMGLDIQDKVSTPDKRFSDPRWNDLLVFDMMKQSYLLTSNWINGLVSSVETVDPVNKRKAEFFTRLLTDAFSPSNFAMTNPAVIDKILESKGQSLVKGMENFAEDLARGNGKLKISQADTGAFVVGRDVATTPGKVVYRSAFFELIQYSPTTPQVCETPLLIFPPWINKFYILDLQPKNSLIKWLTDQGFSVFITSWVNPDVTMKDKNFEDYLKHGIYDAIAQVKKQCGVDQVNTVGYCIGGTLLGSALAHMKSKGDKSVKSATFFTAQHDFSAAGDLQIFTDEAWLKDLEDRMDAAGGVLPGEAMADTFNALRANDLIWSFFVNNYLLGKSVTAFDLLCWNSDQTRMPKALHMFYLRKFYNENQFARGELVLDGVKLDPKSVTIPIFAQSGREDHIAPPASVYRSAKLFGGPVTFMLAGSGHIAGVVNPPAANKYQHWINSALPETLDQWLEGAVEHKGSWWEYWAEWLKDKSGANIPARDPTKGALKPIMDAPGSYVLVKS